MKKISVQNAMLQLQNAMLHLQNGVLTEYCRPSPSQSANANHVTGLQQHYHLQQQRLPAPICLNKKFVSMAEYQSASAQMDSLEIFAKSNVQTVSLAKTAK